MGIWSLGRDFVCFPPEQSESLSLNGLQTQARSSSEQSKGDGACWLGCQDRERERYRPQKMSSQSCLSQSGQGNETSGLKISESPKIVQFSFLFQEHQYTSADSEKDANGVKTSLLQYHV